MFGVGYRIFPKDWDIVEILLGFREILKLGIVSYQRSVQSYVDIGQGLPDHHIKDVERGAWANTVNKGIPKCEKQGYR